MGKKQDADNTDPVWNSANKHFPKSKASKNWWDFFEKNGISLSHVTYFKCI